MMFFWIAVVVFIVYLINNNTNSEKDNIGGKKAEEIVSYRYARGEISKDEYEEILQNLTGK